MKPVQPELKLLTIPELATILRMGIDGVRKMIKRGELPGIKLGGRWFVREHSLILKLEHMETDATPLEGDDLRALAYGVPDFPADPEFEDTPAIEESPGIEEPPTEGLEIPPE